VATQVGGVPYLIEHGINGFLFPAKDHQALARHLVTLAASPDLRKKLGQRLLEKAKRDFSIEHTIQRQMDIYDTILRRHHRPRRKRDGIIICGAYGRGNAGDEAILEAILMEMRAIDPDIPLWVMTRKPKDTRLRHRVNAVYIFNIPGFTHRMARSSLYINGGGSLMQDVTSRRSLWFYLYTLDAAKRRGCKVMMYGCGIGPINYPYNRKRAHRTINRAVDVITLRDRSSLDELTGMDINNPTIILSADPTVTLPAAPVEVADSLLEAAGLSPGSHQHYLGISVRPWPGFEEKASVFAQAADYAYETYGLIPVFLPIEAKLDIDAAKQVARHIKHAPYAIMQGCASSQHTIALFSRMDVVLSMRLHALVFSAGHGVPLVGVVYDPKVSSFLDALGQNLYTPLDRLTADDLRAHLDAAVARTQNRSLLEAGAQDLLRLERQNAVQARRLLDSE
jgi:polysaccharide pyruvyl transferase CsaB